MGAPSSEVGYTIATSRRENDEVLKNRWWHYKEKKILRIKKPEINRLIEIKFCQLIHNVYLIVIDVIPPFGILKLMQFRIFLQGSLGKICHIVGSMRAVRQQCGRQDIVASSD